MEVVVTSEQIRRLALKLLERIYGKLRKYKGLTYDEIFADENGNPRIAVNHKIFESPVVLITKADFDLFTSVMPLEPNEFGYFFKEWFKENYFPMEFKGLTTTSPSKMDFVNPLYSDRFSNY